MSPIASKLTQRLAGLQEKIPEQQVGLIPADAFFTRKVELPEGISREERLAFIQLNLEGNSPFPMEQLAWGCLEDPKSSHAFVYATPKARLRKLGIEAPESYFQLFPGFVSLFGTTPDRATIRFLSQNGVLSALYMEAGNPVPSRIQSRHIPGELLTDEAHLEARDAFLKSLPREDYRVEDGLWLGSGLEIDNDGSIEFRHRHLARGKSEGLLDNTLRLDDQGLWLADLRDEQYAGRERKVRQRSSLIWTSLRAGLWFALLLLVLQLGNFALLGLNKWRESRIHSVEPQATRVENKKTLAARLTQSTDEDLRPFLLLESINSLRPDSVFFDKVRSRAYNELEIEGQSAEGVTPVNAFADAIKKQDFVQSVETNPQTRTGQTSFELMITFSQMPPAPEGGFMVPPEGGEETSTSSGGEE